MRQVKRFGLGLAMSLIYLGVLFGLSGVSSSQTDPPKLAVISAASFTANIAPDSIVAVFGLNLAARSEAAAIQPLPTTLGGASVTIAGRPAPLFFASPNQVNLLIPPETASGAAVIEARNGGAVVGRTTLEIKRAAPGLFTANASGSGLPAALALRVRGGAQSYETIDHPLDLGAVNEQLYLILFGTGLRGRISPADVLVRIGGINAPADAAPVSGLVGLDQVNVLLPRELIGRGRVNLALTVNGFGAANLVEVEIAGATNSAPPQIASYSAATALAGSLLTINGAGFSPNAMENTVRIGGVEARVEAASATQLTIRIPFGGQSGPVSVRTPQGEGQGIQALQMRTSISGVVEDTRRQPLAGVTVRVLDRGIQAVTGAEGSFLLPDVPASLAQELEFDGGTVPGSLPFPKVTLKKRVLANRDNQMDSTIALQQISGPAIPVGSGNVAFSQHATVAKLAGRAAPHTPQQTGRTGNVIFEVPLDAAVSFPDGATRGSLNLTVVENSRTPVALPPGIFSTVVAQITTIGVMLNPGGKLNFPNTDNLPANTAATLYKFDQRPGSPTLGSFVAAGTATVSGDGQRLETLPGAVTETTLYFATAPRLTTTVVGRVVDSNGLTPVRQARVRARGQEGLTDGNGGFVLPGVLVNPNDQLSVEASFQRPNGRVERVQRGGIPAVVGGSTVVENLTLPAEASNRPPVMLLPPTLTMSEGEVRVVNFVASDPDAGQTVVDVRVSGARFASVTRGGNDLNTLRLNPAANDAGAYTLILTATDNLGASLTQNIALAVGRLPLAQAQTVTTDEDTSVSITLTGSDPGGQSLSYLIATNPARGTLSGTAPNLTYVPAANYNGADSFTFRVNNGFSDSVAATISIIINPVNDPPVLTVPGPQTANTGQRLSFTVTASDPDANQTLSFSATGLPAGATFTTLAPTRAQFAWTPSFAQAGVVQVSLRVMDNGTPPMSDTKPVRVTVLGSWAQTAGPEGGTINALLSTATSLFAGTEGGGVFRSNDSGTSWTAVNTGLPTLFVYALAANGGTLFAATDLGVFRSTDNGTNWTATNSGLPPNRKIKALAVSGTNVFACFDANVPGDTSGVFRSTSNGQAWTATGNGLPGFGTDFHAFAVDGNNIYVGGSSGVFFSANQGQSWTAINNGLERVIVTTLVVSGANLFAGTGVSSGVRRGVFLSTNNGQNWTPVNSGLPQQEIRAFAVSGTKLFVATEGNGIYLTTSNGQVWTAVNAGLTHLRVRALASNGNDLFAGTDKGGVFFSPNDGQNWAAANYGLTATHILSLAASGNHLFAGTNGNGVHWSADNGQTWTAVNAGLPVDTPINALLVKDNLLFAGTERGVFRSTDSGATWTAALPNTATLTLAVSGTNFFAGTVQNGVFRSANEGANWVAASGGLPFGFMSTLRLPIAALATNSTAIFAGTPARRDGGVYRSTDNGANWLAVNAGLPDTNTLGIYIPPGMNALAANSTNVFAATAGYGVFRSITNGGNWTPVNAGLPANAVLTALVVNQTALFAGSATNGIFLSTNNGASWTAVNSGLTNPRILSLAANGTTLLAGTAGSGVFVAQ